MALNIDTYITDDNALKTLQFELAEDLTGYQLHMLLAVGWVIWSYCGTEKTLVWVYDRVKCRQALSAMEKLLRCQKQST